MTAEDRLLIKLYELKKAERLTEWLLKCLGALHRLVLHHLIMDTDHLKQVLNSCLNMMSQELVKCGLDDICCWSIFRVDTSSIVLINSVKFACCSPYFCHDFALKMSPVLMFCFLKRVFKCSIETLSVFVYSTNFWMFDENRVPLLHTVKKYVTVNILLKFTLDLEWQWKWFQWQWRWFQCFDTVGWAAERASGL